MAVRTLTTSTATNGPPVVTLLQARQLSPEEFRATVTAVFLTLDLVATGVFAATGAFTGPGAAAWCLPGLISGGLAGHHARSLLSPRRFRMLVLGGCSSSPAAPPWPLR